MDNKEFLKEIGHTTEDLSAISISVEELRKIFDEHTQRQDELQDMGEAIQRTLTRIPGVHSTRVRVKSARSLVRKVVRKRKGEPGKESKDINFGNYKEEVRDLIGLRALHLFKEEWKPIKEAILEKWDLHPEEKPLAYIRDGDSEELRKSFETADLRVLEKPGGYRSLHFIIVTKFGKHTCYSEIQVRTLFEEAWGEVDHRVRYPDHTDDALLTDYLLVLNRLAGGADELSSLIKRMKAELLLLRLANQELIDERNERIKANDDFVEKLDATDETKNIIKERFNQQEESRQTGKGAIPSAAHGALAFLDSYAAQDAIRRLTPSLPDWVTGQSSSAVKDALSNIYGPNFLKGSATSAIEKMFSGK